MFVNDNLLDIVEDYISDKRNGKILSHTDYTKRLKRLKKSDDQIHEIMIEIDDDCTKELLAGAGIKKAKTTLLLSAIAGFGLASVSILSALGYLFGGRMTVILYGAIATSFLFGAKSYNEIKAVAHRKTRRELKWRNWH